MENYTVEQFLEDVRKEVDAVKLNATPNEIARLEFKKLEPTSFTRCIYGQMTGDCQSLRASELILLCCPRYFENNLGNYESLEDAVGEVNGKQIAGIGSPEKLYQHRSDWLIHLSALEAYILAPEAKSENLIAYLKGETDTLDL